MRLRDLQKEHSDTRIGALWIQHVERRARAVVHTYDPSVYAHGTSWESGLADLVQDVVTERLIAEGQVEYLIDVSSSLNDLNRLLDRQIRLTLAHRRRRTVVDQLLQRSRDIMSETPFVRVSDTPLAWSCQEHETLDRQPTPAELRIAADRVRAIPTIRATSTSGVRQRASAVYRSEDLRRLLEIVCRSLPTALRQTDLDRIFRNLLTPFLRSVLDDGESPSGDSPPTSTEDIHEMSVIATELVSSLEAADRSILAAKLADVSDEDIAQTLNVSRPTAAKRKRTVFAQVGERLTDLAEPLRVMVLDEVGAQVAGMWPPPEVT